METNKYQLDNFVLFTETDEAGESSFVMKSVAGDWRLVYSERHSLFSYWLTLVDMARGQNKVRMVLDATVTMIYQLSNVGIHDPQATNGLVEVLDGIHKRLAEVIEGVTTPERKAEEEKEDKEWLEHDDK